MTTTHALRLHSGGAVFAQVNGLDFVPMPAFELPKAIDHSADLHALFETATACSQYRKEFNAYEDGDLVEWGGVVASAHRTCDFTIKEFRFALTVNWQSLTTCDMGLMSILCRDKDNKIRVLLESGGGENRGCGSEATDEEINEVMAALGLSVGVMPSEFIAVLIAKAGSSTASQSLGTSAMGLRMRIRTL